MGKFKLKASAKDDSGSIIVSFHGKWYEPLRRKEIEIVFRKKGPSRYTPEFMYMYLAAPVKAIIARASVLSYQSLPLETALSFAKPGHISEKELREYAAQPFLKRYDHLIVYGLGPIQVAQSPVSLQALIADYDFWPSPSYIPLSDYGRETLDHIGKFDE